LVALSLLTGRLGLWQLDRADEKRDMAQKRQMASSKPPVALERLHADALTNLEGQRLRLRIDAPLSNWYLDSRTYKGQAGLYVLAVLPLDGPEEWLACAQARAYRIIQAITEPPCWGTMAAKPRLIVAWMASKRSTSTSGYSGQGQNPGWGIRVTSCGARA